MHSTIWASTKQICPGVHGWPNWKPLKPAKAKAVDGTVHPSIEIRLSLELPRLEAVMKLYAAARKLWEALQSSCLITFGCCIQEARETVYVSCGGDVVHMINKLWLTLPRTFDRQWMIHAVLFFNGHGRLKKLRKNIYSFSKRKGWTATQ